ncbi:MAG: hypothetical protein E7418_05780 [Ruminococcaceae bacterium]|nr:hypothetical protein [Oscillospiraceae bacterium]
MKRIMSLLLVFLLALSVCACSKEGGSVAVFENGVYVPQEDLEITVWQTQGTDYTAKALDGSVVEEWLVNKTRVKVKNIYGNDGGQWDAKLSKLVAGDNLPEILACGAYQGPAHFAKLNALKQVWELTPEMLQKYAPNVWKRVPQRYWEAIKVDGKILGIPYNNQSSKETLPDATDRELEIIDTLFKTPVNDVSIGNLHCLFVRDDILKMIYPEAKTWDELVALLEERQEPMGEELLDIPIDTTEEYIDFMYKIQELNLKEGGKTVYPFGYYGGDNWCALAWLGADMYGYKGHAYTGTWNDVTKEIEIPIAGEVVKEAARMQNKMLADMVIDPDSMAHTTAQAKEKMLNGLYAIAPINGVSDIITVNDSLEKQGKSFRYRPFITQIPAQEGYGAFEEDQMWTSSLCILKTVDENQLYQILNWLDVQFTDEWDSVRHWGPEEAGLYTVGEDGKRQFVDERFTKYFVDGNTDALKPEEGKGLHGTIGYNTGGLFTVAATATTRWTPKVHLEKITYKPALNSGFKFKSDSEHVTSVKMYPPCQGWSSIYADIPEVVTFWAEREQWENMFKVAMAAPVGEFDEKWDEAVEDLNAIVDVELMEEKMTEIARPLAEILEQEQ